LLKARDAAVDLMGHLKLIIIGNHHLNSKSKTTYL
jgi:hypothetical protein